MIDLKNAVISLIFCAVAVGLCELLIPKKSFNNQMRLITGTVLLISMLSPFLNGINMPDFDFSQFNNSIDVSDSTERSVAYAMKNEIAEILYENKIDNAKITINTGFDERKSIIIESVIILFDEKDKTGAHNVVKQIENKLKVNVKTGVI